MQFRPDELQQQLEDSVQRFAQAHEDVASWQLAARERGAFRPEVWKAMADLGWLAAIIPEEFGGMGLGAREAAIVMEGMGRALILEPYWSTAVFGVRLLLEAGTRAQQEQWLPRVADGSLRLAVAVMEPGTRFEWTEVRCTARREGERWRIDGRKVAVLDGAVADRLLLLARADDGESAIFCVDAQADGIRRRDGIALDERSCSDFSFDGVLVPEGARLGVSGCAVAGMRKAMEFAMAALSAESVGAMSALLRTTVEYLKTRKQFGRPLSEFQVLRHRVADMVMATEQTRSLALMAAMMLDAQPEQATRWAMAAKIQAGQAGRFVGESAVQLHGGIGMTDELHAGHYLKRLICIDVLLGDSAFHLKRFGDTDSALPAPAERGHAIGTVPA
jgi:alkylation response protein AidB-like acyl-CoA dehydrogenase